jgi:hypoxanthine phosphoribosyltransferase
VTADDLANLRDLLADATRQPGVEAEVRAGFQTLREVVAELIATLPRMDERDRERLALNADLPQLHFHLAEELRAPDPATTPDSLAFMHRHVPRLLAEFRDRAHERLDPLDADLLLGLARLTRATYERDFAHRYERAGYRRPFVDKLYRDYALTGIPGGLLLELERLATATEHDVVLCVLKGALPYVVLMERCGLAHARVRHVMCGRATGSHVDPRYVVAPLAFELSELAGRSVLIVDNNVASGATLAHLASALAASPPARTTLFLDYALAPVDELDLRFDDLVCGPFDHDRPEQARDLKHRLVQRLRDRAAHR